MNFSNYEEYSKKIGIGTEFFRLEKGENKMRILSLPEHLAVHFLDKPVPCIGANCSRCGNNKPSHKILVHILDRRDEQVKEAELPWSVYTGLGILSKSTDFGFDNLPPYDVNIIRSGEAKSTEYTVHATRNEAPLTPEQIDQLSQLPKPSDTIVKRLKEAENYRP